MSPLLVVQLVCLAGQLVLLVLIVRNARRAQAAAARTRAAMERIEAINRRAEIRRGGRP